MRYRPPRNKWGADFAEDYEKNLEDIERDITGVQEQFNQVVIEGDSSVEAAQARVDAKNVAQPTLKARLDKDYNEVTAQLAEKAQQTYVETMLATAVSGAPKGFYNTLAALKSAYPQGTDGVFLVLENGHIYIWDGAQWADAGVYQGIEVPNKSVTEKKTTFIDVSKNLFNKANVIKGQYRGSGGTVTANSSFFSGEDYIKVEAGKTYSFPNAQTYIVMYNEADKAYWYSWVITKVEGASQLSWTCGPNDVGKVIKISSEISKLDTFMFNEGSTLLPYEEYGKKLREDVKLQNIGSYIEDGSITEEQTTFIHTSPNMLNNKNVTKGMYLGAQGVPAENSSYFYGNDYIPVKAGQTYSFPNVNVQITMYNELDKSYYYFFNLATVDGANQIKWTASATDTGKCIRISAPISSLPTFMMNEGSNLLPYEDYGKKLNTDINIEKLNSLSDQVTDLSNKILPVSNVLFDEKFNTSIPTYFNNDGGFTISNGLLSPTTVGYNKTFYYNKGTTLDKNKLIFKFVFNQANSIIGVGSRFVSAMNILSKSGVLVEINSANNTMALKKWNYVEDISVAETISTVSIPFTLATGKSYMVELEKDTYNRYYVTLVDVDLPYNRVQMQNDYAISGKVMQAWGGGCITAIAGSFTVKRYCYMSMMPTKVKVGFFGDSWIEGSGDTSIRYLELIKKDLVGSVFASGQGGAYIWNVSDKRTPDLDSFCKMDYAVLEVGTNDGLSLTTTQFQTAMNEVISFLESKSIEPILVTVSNRSDYADGTTYKEWIKVINPWIRTRGYKYVDIAMAVSTGDGLTQNLNLFTEDKSHLNSEGNKAVYYKFKADVPELFN